jgi:hypothetical protein
MNSHRSFGRLGNKGAGISEADITIYLRPMYKKIGGTTPV